MERQPNAIVAPIHPKAMPGRYRRPAYVGSAKGHSRQFDDVRVTSAFPPIAAVYSGYREQQTRFARPLCALEWKRPPTRRWMRDYTAKEKGKITAGAMTSLVIVGWAVVLALAFLSAR